MKNQLSILLILFPTLWTASCKSKKTDERVLIANEMENSLTAELLEAWYPKAMDLQFGGFLSTFSYDFQPTGSHDKMIVSQARHTWTNSKALKLYPEVSHFKTCADHGYRFLRDVMWDKSRGGFHTLVDRQGNVKSDGKTAYGNAFGVYALAAYYDATRDSSALKLAQEAFYWLEKHSHDPVHKGYFQHLQNDGKIIQRDNSIPSTSDMGYKDQNSSIHLLEAFTELYAVWPDSLLAERLREMLFLIRDTITTKEGYMMLFFEPDWTPVSFKDSTEEVILKHRSLDHVSFGHDVETAYLLLEASHVVGLKDDKTTLAVAKRMVDHALNNGWDNSIGGFYDEGYYFNGRNQITILKETKNWWAQAEGLNTLQLMAEYFPNDNQQYFGKFKKLWNYTKNYLIDHEYGGWYQGGLDKEPKQKTALKGHIWKASYHQFRSLANCIERLRSRASPHSTSVEVIK